jgi:hypothetical protein
VSHSPTICMLCAGRLDEPSLVDPATGAAVHPACVAMRVPQDALLALVGALVLVLVPSAVVWAG